MRYEINKTTPDAWSVLDKKTGKYVVVNETYQVCANTEHALNHPKLSGVSECDEVADAIRVTE